MRYGVTHCLACRYELAGLTGEVCPECGGAFVDAAARLQAAGLIERFRDYAIPNADLLERWPGTPADIALAVLRAELTTRFRDYRVVGLRARDTPEPTRADRLTRWAVFLRSGIEYPQCGDQKWFPFADEAGYARAEARGS